MHGKDEENDLAILEVQGLRGYALGLALTPVQVGQEIYVLSNPEEYEGTFTRGMVNAYRERDMQIDAPLSHGSSGGPVFNALFAEMTALLNWTSNKTTNLRGVEPRIFSIAILRVRLRTTFNVQLVSVTSIR